MWDVILTTPQTLEKILKELLSKQSLVPSDAEKACITHLAVSYLEKSEKTLVAFSAPCRLCRYLTAVFVSAGGLH